jgi:hypothetical protein
MIDEYVNGYVERKKDGTYSGSLTIEGINLQGGITAVYFKDEGKNYLWLRRKKVLDYDFETQTYKERDARPQFEAYLKKQIEEGAVAYKGEFVFMRFRYSIKGVWDRILGNEKQRLNLFVERLPLPEQTIINCINEAKKNK